MDKRKECSQFYPCISDIQNFDSDKSGSSKNFQKDFSTSANERGNLRVSRANARGQRVVSYSSVPASPANSGKTSL